jgi:hypothetical protein
MTGASYYPPYLLNNQASINYGTLTDWKLRFSLKDFIE